MKTLYDYFIDVYATELDNYAYPNTKEILIEEFKANYYVSDLKLSTLITICDVLDKNLSNTVDILFELKNN